MPTYLYNARDDSGKSLKGFLDADNEIGLATHLHKLGYFLVSCKVSSSTRRSDVSASGFGRLSQKELLEFTTQMAISLDAGVPLLTSLQDLAKTASSKNIRDIIADIAKRVESGSSLKDSLLIHKGSFPKLYTSIVSAGESTGKLGLAMNDLAKLIEWQAELSSKIKEASIYPVILFLTMVGVVSVLVIVVIPKFEPMFKDMGMDLPLATQLVLGVSRFVRNFWWVILILAGSLVVLFKYIVSLEKGRLYVDRSILKLPVFGELIAKIALSRFCHTFALSLRSGVDIFTALSISSEVTGNKFIENNVNKAKDYVNIGEKISVSLETVGGFPSLIIRMINVGEQTGNLAVTLEKVNQFYDREVPAAIRKMFALFEPLMIITMGIVVGGIAMAVFMPMVKLVSNIG